MFLGMYVSDFFVISQYSIFKFEYLNFLYGLFFLAFICLGIYPGLHRQIYVMVISFAIIPFLTAGLFLTESAVWDDSAIKIILSSQLASFIVIYPIAISIGAYINKFENENNHPKSVDENFRKNSSFVILGFIVFLLILDAYMLSELGMQGWEAIIFIAIYCFSYLCYYIYAFAFKILHFSVGGLRKISFIRRILEHFFIIIIYIIFFIFLWFGKEILNHVNYNDFNPYYFIGFPVIIQLITILTIRYMAGFMKSYKPTILIFAPTILLYVMIAINIYTLFTVEKSPL